MNNLQQRVRKLEAKQLPEKAMRTVCVYENEITPEELQALRSDKTVGILFIMCNDDEPANEINAGDPRVAGIDI